MLGSFLGVVDFEAIIAGINDTLYGGDAGFFVNGPVSVEGVVAMPLLCGDYGMFFTILGWDFGERLMMDFRL